MICSLIYITCYYSFHLGFVYLYGNKLTGTIPSSLLGINRMKQIMLYDNLLTGTIPAIVGQMKGIGKWQVLQTKIVFVSPHEPKTI